jgi:ferredoxin-NADP reductase
MTLELLVRQMRWESEGVVSLLLEDRDGAQLPPWSAGAHVDVELQPGLVRHYSLFGSPLDKAEYRVAVLAEPGGRGGSRYVHESLRPGHVVGVRGPRNNFVLEDAPAYTFIAGGIGITPLLAMLQAAEARGRPWRLLYGGRSRRSMAFLPLLERYGARVEVVPQDELGHLDLETALRDLGAGEQVYCCGPEPLLVAVEERCAPLGDVLRVERFAAPVATAPAPAGVVEVELARTGRTVTVGAGESILDRVLSLGVEVPNDCREGICGSCETTVLAGTPEHHDYVLTTKERQAGRSMMLCVSRACDRLVLDL